MNTVNPLNDWLHYEEEKKRLKSLTVSFIQILFLLVCFNVQGINKYWNVTKSDSLVFALKRKLSYHILKVKCTNIFVTASDIEKGGGGRQGGSEGEIKSKTDTFQFVPHLLTASNRPIFFSPVHQDQPWHPSIILTGIYCNWGEETKNLFNFYRQI